MSKIQKIDEARHLIQAKASSFERLAKIHGAVNFEREASFAIQKMQESDFLLGTAINNKVSLQNAVINVAAIGLTLNPAFSRAYLVPRDKKVCLDISYRGFVHLAIEAGAILWAHAEVVREKDTFELNGFDSAPTHKFEPFGERGLIIGVYVTVKLPSGDFLTTPMAKDEVESIRNRGASWKAHISKGKSTPWATDEGEMYKKTVVKRAWKMWPSSTLDRFAKAVEVSNEIDGINFQDEISTNLNDNRNQLVNSCKEILDSMGKDHKNFFLYAEKFCSRPIDNWGELIESELSTFLPVLEQMQAKHESDSTEKTEEAEEKEVVVDVIYTPLNVPFEDEEAKHEE